MEFARQLLASNANDDPVDGFCETLSAAEKTLALASHDSRSIECEDMEKESGYILSLGIAGGIVALVFAGIFTQVVMGSSAGNNELLLKNSQYIHAGAKAFLLVEYKWLCLFVFALCVGLGILFGLLDQDDDNAWVYTLVALVSGATLSAIAGWIGMFIATKANIRTTVACRAGLADGLGVAFKSGAVMALSVTGLGLCGLMVFVAAYMDLTNEWNYIAGFGMGASSIALFARVGGGVYTKAADVGADLVGKVEANIPEDDARNPAVIADNVGDNVGDVAGMGADLFESYVGSIIAACTLAHTNLVHSTDIVNILLMAAWASGGRFYQAGGCDNNSSITEADCLTASGIWTTPNYAELTLDGTNIVSMKAATRIVGDKAAMDFFYQYKQFAPEGAITALASAGCGTTVTTTQTFLKLALVEGDESYKLYEKTVCDANGWAASESCCIALERQEGSLIDSLAASTTLNRARAAVTGSSMMPQELFFTDSTKLVSGGIPKKIPFLRMDQSWNTLALPFWIAGVGIMCSVVGVYLVRDWLNKGNAAHQEGAEEKSKAEAAKEDEELLEYLLNITRFAIGSAGLMIVLACLGVCLSLFDGGDFGLRIWGCIIVGLVCGICIGIFTEYCTSYTYSPTQSIAEMSRTGPATVIIQGMGIGMISTVVPSGLLVVAIVVTNELAGVYGISIAAVGMLSTLGVTLATDAYGPVADNAGGLAEMCLTDDKDSYVRDRTDALDALGNTTAATGKGFAIGSAVLTSVGLIAAYMDETGLQTGDVDLQDPYVLCGALIGAMLPFLFGALTMLSVGRSAEAIILKVRAQFYVVNMEIKAGKYKECASWDDFDPNIHMAQEDADVYYADCIEIATGSALREMLIPGFMAVVMPAVVGFLLGAPALAGLLVGALTSGFMLAVTMANAGGAWDNAKKYCEKGALGEGRGKGSEAHAATVVGDTVGDPFKDTSGPALNILIKLMSIVSLVLAPVFKKCCQSSFEEDGIIAGVVLLAILLLSSVIISRWMNKLAEEFKLTVEEEKNKSLSTIKNPLAANGEAKNGEAKNGTADEEESTSGAAVVPVDKA